MALRPRFLAIEPEANPKAEKLVVTLIQKPITPTTMRRFTLLIVALFLAVATQAEGLNTYYCSLSGASFATIDYGQTNRQRNWLVDQNGKAIYFRSAIQAMNFMAERGWKFERAITTVDSTLLDPNKVESTTTLIFSKEAESRDQLTEGITTRLIFLGEEDY